MIETISSGFDSLLTLIESIQPAYIYLILFGIAFMENIVPPIPGDTFTLIAGYLAALGKLSAVPAFAVITSGTIASVMLIFMLGYRGGWEFFERRKFKVFDIKDMQAVNRWFAKYGALTMLFSRFVVGGRVAIAIGAGIAKYSPTRMFVYSYISGILFHGVLFVLAYMFHAYIESLADGFNIYSKIIVIIVTGLVLAWLVLLVKRLIYGRKSA